MSTPHSVHTPEIAIPDDAYILQHDREQRQRLASQYMRLAAGEWLGVIEPIFENPRHQDLLLTMSAVAYGVERDGKKPTDSRISQIVGSAIVAQSIHLSGDMPAKSAPRDTDLVLYRRLAFAKIRKPDGANLRRSDPDPASVLDLVQALRTKHLIFE